MSCVQTPYKIWAKSNNAAELLTIWHIFAVKLFTGPKSPNRSQGYHLRVNYCRFIYDRTSGIHLMDVLYTTAENGVLTNVGLPNNSAADVRFRSKLYRVWTHDARSTTNVKGQGVKGQGHSVTWYMIHVQGHEGSDIHLGITRTQIGRLRSNLVQNFITSHRRYNTKVQHQRSKVKVRGSKVKFIRNVMWKCNVTQ